MKLFINDKQYRETLNKHFKDTIAFVDTKTEADIIISGRFEADDYHDHLKAVIIPYTGHDQIDLETLKTKNVPLFNTTVHSKFVAEKAFALLLALLGNVVNYHNNLKEGDWSDRHNPNRTPWVSLYNQRVGIYGYGRIGRFIRDMLEPFQCRVSVIDRGKDYPHVETVNDLETLITNNDILMIAAPLTEATKHAFDQKHMKRMMGRYLVNVGRGEIIEEEALYQALKDGVLKGFASDVWYQYPSDDQPLQPSKFPIHDFDNVVISPHSGGHTTTSKGAMMARVVEHIEHIKANNYSDAIDLSRLK